MYKMCARANRGRTDRNMMLQSIIDYVAFAKGKTNESFEAIQIERDLTSPAVSRAANKDFADFFFCFVLFCFYQRSMSGSIILESEVGRKTKTHKTPLNRSTFF